MISRRAFLVAGAAGLVAVAVWRVDADIPVRPVVDPDDIDVRDEALGRVSALLAAALTASPKSAPLLRDQLTALGATGEDIDAIGAAPTGNFAADASSSADEVAALAMRAGARDLVLALASVSAGLRQIARSTR